jgi:hypothetical protein
MVEHKLDKPSFSLAIASLGILAVGALIVQTLPPLFFWLGIIMCAGSACVTVARYGTSIRHAFDHEPGESLPMLEALLVSVFVVIEVVATIYFVATAKNLTGDGLWLAAIPVIVIGITFLPRAWVKWNVSQKLNSWGLGGSRLLYITYDDGRAPEYKFEKAGRWFFPFIIIAGVLFAIPFMYGMKSGVDMWISYEDGPNPTFFLPPNQNWRGRQFVIPPVSEFREYFEKYTDAQAARMTAPYLGKWVAASGTVKNIDDYDPGSRFAHEEVDLTGDMKAGTRSLEFEAAWGDQVDLFQKGYEITAYCKISRISVYTVEMTSCELAPPQSP